MRVPPIAVPLVACLAVLAAWPAAADYTNFEVSHVHPLALTPSGDRLLAINTPDATLEIFAVDGAGALTHEATVPVGLEPVSVAVRDDADEAWVVNQLSDSVSIVDLAQQRVVRTLQVGDEPGDVVFAGGRAFVSVAGEDRLLVFSLADPSAAPTAVPLAARKPRALATDGTTVWTVSLWSGNRTTVVDDKVIFGNNSNLNGPRLSALGLNDITCGGTPPSYPPLPSGITRNPALVDPPSGVPAVGLIVGWNAASGRWEDETGTSWNDCLPLRVSDHDLFAVDAATLAVTPVDSLGTTLFDVSLQPGSGKLLVSNTDARNRVRFEHPLGLQGHVVDDRLSIVDPGNGNAVTVVDLNAHVDRGSDPATNLAERLASISQPGQLVWNDDGSQGWLAGLGSRKVFRVDGACAAPGCIFGADRSAPVAVEVGGGPSGLAWDPARGRMWVMLRFDNEIATVDTAALAVVDATPLHDPSPTQVRDGRHLLYDGIVGSGHGDAACSSCHVSGDRDDLVWDLGNPEGNFSPYTAMLDNIRFIVPIGGMPTTCDASSCAAHAGHDPQKGPMATQTLHGMLEPLHWRGDRATFKNFNQAFVSLMGTADIGPIDGQAAGLSDPEMSLYRQFALGITFPPNPHRLLDDTLPDTDVLVRGAANPGNPTLGQQLFDSGNTDAGQPCKACHAHPFGAAGGTLGGVTPTEPTSAQTAALFNGAADQTAHSDLKVAHLRNMYEKQGPTFGTHGGTPPQSLPGTGFTHDGALPDLNTFFSFNVFTLTVDQVRDVSAFSLFFPTGTKPAVGAQVTLPAGTPPTGAAQDEARLTTLLAVGDGSDANRHCELTASAPLGGATRYWRLAGGSWLPDAAGEAAVTTTALREAAEGPVTFFCVPPGSGERLGGDRDEDATLNADDCAASDPTAWLLPGELGGLTLSGSAPPALDWSDASPDPGPSLRYDVLGGSLVDLRASGVAAATSCVAGGLGASELADAGSDPSPGAGLFWLVRATSACGAGDAGAGRQALAALDCP